MSKNLNKMLSYNYPSEKDKKHLLEELLKPTLWELLQSKEKYIIFMPLTTK